MMYFSALVIICASSAVTSFLESKLVRTALTWVFFIKGNHSMFLLAISCDTSLVY